MQAIDYLYPWHEKSLEQLAASRSRPGHAWLLEGPEGCDPEPLASAFAALVLCEAVAGGSMACGQCSSCRWLASGSHPDYRRVQPSALALVESEEGEDEPQRKSSTKPSEVIKIEQIRALGDFLSVGTHRGGWRIVQIDPAHRLTAESANALLKTLEEPIPQTLFLLASDQAQALPATIRSRCLQFRVPLPAPDALVSWLGAKLGIDRPEAERVVRLAGGRPSQALIYADKAQAATHRSVMELLASLPDTEVAKVADQLQAVAPVQWVPLLAAWVEDLQRVAMRLEPRRFPEASGRLRDLVARLSPWDLSGFSQWLARERPLLRHPLNARLFAERILDRYSEVIVKKG